MKRLISVLIICFASCSLLTGFSSGTVKITNNLSGIGLGTGKQGVYLCYNPVDDHYNHPTGNVFPTQSFNLPSGMFSNFNVRLNGCNGNTDTYIGNFTLTNDGGVVTVIHPTFSNLATINALQIANGSLSGKLAFIAPPTEKLIIPQHKVNQQSPWPFVGVNLSGNEFGKLWSPINSPSTGEWYPLSKLV